MKSFALSGPKGIYLACPQSLKQLNTETPYCERKEPKANDGDDDAGQQGRPESEAHKQKRKCQEHWQSGDDVPERVPGMVGDFFCRLFFYVEPDQGEHRHQR